MDKKEAITLINNTFNARFEIDKYTFFIRNLLNNYNEEKERDWSQGNFVYESFREHINRFKRLGVFVDPEGNEVELLIIETKGVSKLERARTSLRNFVIKRLNDKNREYALAAFYSKDDEGADWRFSFIKIEHEAFKDNKGKIKTKKDLTPAKRFSFLVGEHEHSYTAQKQLLPLLQNDYSNPTVEDLEKGFSIEKVTAEFFEQYKELYLKLSEHFMNDDSIQRLLNNSGIEKTRFTKKLLGQIVFLYFLQKKGWLGVPKNEPWGKGDRKYLQSLYNAANNSGKNFFKDYLQYLFYEALAKARSNRPDPSYYKRFDCKIPFLNGGLFEADYPWETANLSIPNELFRNEEKNKAGDKGTGVLDVFDRYNFTIKEDEPLEKEVAVDPEMLGKVFENMLEITERKSKGAYYTPREIVHYMCHESLIHYLDNAVNDATESYQPIDSDQLQIFGGSTDKKGQRKFEIEHKGKTLIPKTDIEDFIRNGHLYLENESVAQSANEKIKAGVQKTTKFRQCLSDDIIKNADLIDEKLASIKICDPAIGSGAFPVGLLHELVTAQKVLLPFLSEEYLNKKLKLIELEKADYEKEKYYYRIKRYAIQESIYGVDIDASAIDIARLRLWLSLIVDEEDFYSIEALPNLDYKIVRGNSLIGFPEGWQSPAFDKIEKLKNKFFDETDSEKKKELKAQIDNEINIRLHSSKSVFGYQVDFDFKLFFSEVWHYKNGFDIVIGNPPYVEARQLKQSEVDFFRANYESAGNRVNTFAIFTEKGIKILSKRNCLAFIIHRNSIRSNDYNKLRKYILINTTILNILSFKIGVFEKVTGEVTVLVLKNNPANSTHKINVSFYNDTITDRGENKTICQDIFNKLPDYRFNIYLNDIIINLQNFIKKNTQSLGTIASITQGIIVGDEKKLITKSKNADNFKPILRGRNISKFNILYNDDYSGQTEPLFWLKLSHPF